MPRRKIVRPAAWAVLLCCLAGCATTTQPGPTPEPTPAAEVTATPTPTAEVTPEITATPEEPLPPVRSEERFSAGIDTWGTQHFSAHYEDEYGPIYNVDVTLPWTTVDGEGYDTINKRFEELMEEYKEIRVYRGMPPEDRPLATPSFHLHLDLVRQTPMEVGRLVTFRLQRIDYSGGAHGDCFAWPETYDVTTGELLGFEDFFTDPEDAEARILAEVWRQVELDQETYQWLFVGRSIPAESLLTECFNRSLVYPVEDGFEVFYQWYSIGGHAFGAPTFLIPWEVLEGVTDTSVFGTALETEPFTTLLQERGEFYGRDGQLVYEYDISLPFFFVSRGPYVSISRYYQEWMKELTELMEESAQDTLLYTEEQDFPFSMGGYFLLHAEPTFCNGDGLLQVCGAWESYGAGAAHPLHAAFSHTFDRFTGERIELPDLFSDWESAKEIIWEAIHPQILERFPGYPPEEPAGHALEQLDQNPVFFLETEGLTIHYNEYDIAAYVYGPSEFFVPKEDLSGLTSYPIWD